MLSSSTLGIDYSSINIARAKYYTAVPWIEVDAL
jgi:hypothetical protein